MPRTHIHTRMRMSICRFGITWTPKPQYRDGFKLKMMTYQDAKQCSTYKARSIYKARGQSAARLCNNDCACSQ